MNPMLHIRKAVFGVPQTEMGEIAGVSQGTVSKWENGSLEPDRFEMDRIRNEATKRDLDWNDRWFFEVPASAAVTEAAE
jgi:transcriptional regulator with XRE-family HTH domain